MTKDEAILYIDKCWSRIDRECEKRIGAEAMLDQAYRLERQEFKNVWHNKANLIGSILYGANKNPDARFMYGYRTSHKLAMILGAELSDEILTLNIDSNKIDQARKIITNQA